MMLTQARNNSFLTVLIQTLISSRNTLTDTQKYCSICVFSSQPMKLTITTELPIRTLFFSPNILFICQRE